MYGRGFKDLIIDAHAGAYDVTVIEPSFVPGLADEREAVFNALDDPLGTPPLKDLIRPNDTVAVVVPDSTRPLPTKKIVSWLLEYLSWVGPVNFVFIVGTGSHRKCTEEELKALLGERILKEHKVVNHNAFDGSNEFLGSTRRGTRVFVDREYVAADKRILVGLVEPHFFAGFSGGPKAVAPGISGIETILSLHSYEMIDHPSSTWAVLDGNPVYEESLEACSLLPPDFCLNLTVNRMREITGVFAGETVKAHRAGCEFVRAVSVKKVFHEFDVVITTNGGWPLDQNLYQTVKGLSAAAQVVKTGGSIICASECADGIPEHGNFKRILLETPSPEGLLEAIRSRKTPEVDQWQVQVLARVLAKAQVYLYSSLPDTEVRAALMTPVHDLEATLEREARRHGEGAKVAILPEGPFTVPVMVRRG
ncbi:MAG TPA: nickel-dependent lactate racemase [Clostridia bacterium]|nr:nickel-dependent lactate racemase [Clostridia bacterium]